MTDTDEIWSRRRLLRSAVGASGLLLAGCGQTEPPTYGNLLRMGDYVTYKAHRLFLPEQSLAREYNRSDISPIPATGTVDPGNPDAYGFNPTYGENYARLHRGKFADWRISVEGSVVRPATFSLADLQRMPARTQITRHTCEEGWSAIAEWTGVPLSHVLQTVGILPEARYVQFFAYDYFADGIDMLDALHPQTILAYGLNGRSLPLAHGAPLRLRVERQIGYKSMKFLRRIVVTDKFEDHGVFGPLQNGWSWYAGI